MAGRTKNRKVVERACDETPASAPPAPLSIGILSDTHGVLSPVVAELFAGVTHIIHAGDVGRRSILRKLEKIAPVTAVAGNADGHALAASLPTVATGEISGVRFLVVHKPKAVRRLLPSARRDGVRLIVTGHLHEPSFRWEDGILHINPGSASAPDEGDSQATVAVVGLLPEGLAVSFIPVPRPTAAGRPRAKGRGRTGKAKGSGKREPAQASAGDVPAKTIGIVSNPEAATLEEMYRAAVAAHGFDLDEPTGETVFDGDGDDGSQDYVQHASPLPTVTFPDSGSTSV